MGEAGLMGRGMDGPQRSLGSQWSKRRYMVLRTNSEQEKVCVFWSEPHMAVCTGRSPTPWRKLPYNKSLAGNKECHPIQRWTVLAEGQIPDCGPDHSEVKAGPRTSWFYKPTCAGTVHFLCDSSPPQEEASQMHVWAPDPLMYMQPEPKAMSFTALVSHMDRQHSADWHRRMYWGQGAGPGRRPSSTDNLYIGVRALAMSHLCFHICKEALLDVRWRPGQP